MEQALSKIGTAIRPRLDWLAAVLSVGGFVWLLTQDLIEPLTVYVLQLYLTF